MELRRHSVGYRGSPRHQSWGHQLTLLSRSAHRRRRDPVLHGIFPGPRLRALALRTAHAQGRRSSAISGPRARPGPIASRALVGRFSSSRATASSAPSCGVRMAPGWDDAEFRDINPSSASSSPERMRGTLRDQGRGSSPPTTGPTVPSCGAPTARRRERRWSETSSRAAENQIWFPTASPGSQTSKGRFSSSADDGAHGFELWRSDGTEDGTSLVRDQRPEALTRTPGSKRSPIRGSPSCRHFQELQAVAFGWHRGRNGADPRPQAQETQRRTCGEGGGTLFFTNVDPIHGRELWRSDGTPEGAEAPSRH